MVLFSLGVREGHLPRRFDAKKVDEEDASISRNNSLLASKLRHESSMSYDWAKKIESLNTEVHRQLDRTPVQTCTSHCWVQLLIQFNAGSGCAPETASIRPITPIPRQKSAVCILRGQHTNWPKDTRRGQTVGGTRWWIFWRGSM